MEGDEVVEGDEVLEGGDLDQVGPWRSSGEPEKEGPQPLTSLSLLCFSLPKSKQVPQNEVKHIFALFRGYVNQIQIICIDNLFVNLCKILSVTTLHLVKLMVI